MYLSSHFSASLEVYFFTLKAPEQKTPEDYNFIVVQNGSISISDGTDQYILSQGDIYLLQPEQTYTLNHFSSNFCLNLQLSRKFIEQMIPHDGTLVCNSAAGKKNDYRELAQVLTELAVHYPKEDREELLISLLFRLLDLLKRQGMIQIRPGGDNDVIAERLDTIQTYIQQNFHLPITLKELAEQMYLSPQYLSKFIKQHMKITFIHYLNKVRMEHACEELFNTDHSVTRIAFHNGFPSTAAFNKSFRELYQESPSSFRQARREQAAAARADTEFSHIVAGFDAAPASAAAEELLISVRQSAPYYAGWSDTINIGFLPNALSTRFHETFQSFQRAIGFRYVRFEDIFSAEIMRSLDDGKTFDYTNLNIILDFFKSIEVLPFIELSFKPHKHDLISYRKYSAEESFRAEKALSFYYYALDDLLRHCINRYGYTYVSQWRFEIWMKHDEMLRYLNTAREYLDTFCAFRAIIKQLLPDCMVGGPGFNSSAERAPLIELLEEMNRRQMYPDFFSLYIYGHDLARYDSHGSIEGTHVPLSADPDVLLHRYQFFVKTIRAITKTERPVYVTEFNSGLYGNNYVSASAFQAVFICKSALSLLKETPCLAYWHFSDIPRQFSISPRIYSNDTGLIDSHGLPKAPFFTYILLGRLQQRLVALGESYIVTTNGNHRYQLLAYHYCHYTPHYCMNYLTPLDISHTYDVFEEHAPKSMQLCLTDLPAGRYKTTRLTLSRSYGSMIDEFIRIYNKGYQTMEELNYMILNMQKSDLDYYMHTVRPRQETRYMETDQTNSLVFSFTMEPHEIVVFDLAKQVRPEEASE